MNLIIAGGRDFTDYELMCNSFDFSVCWEFGEVGCVFSGCAKGADTLGERLALERGIRISKFPAQWDYHGKKAGVIRNEEMAEWADGLLAFWDGASRGTKHMIDYAKSQGLIVHVVNYEPENLMNEPMNVIFDLETVNTTPDAAVASIALIVFGPSELQDFDGLVSKALRVKLNLNEQFGMGRTWNQETVDWWNKPEQAEAYQRVIVESSDDVSITQLPAIINNYLSSMGYKPNIGEKVYCRGFMDVPILDSVYKMLGAEPSMPWWCYRDVRTEIDAIAPYSDEHHQAWGNMKDFVNPPNFVKHVETHDCAIDVMKMQHAHLKLMESVGLLK